MVSIKITMVLPSDTTSPGAYQFYQGTATNSIPGHYVCKHCTLTLPTEDACWQLGGGLVHSSGLIGFPHAHIH